MEDSESQPKQVKNYSSHWFEIINFVWEPSFPPLRKKHERSIFMVKNHYNRIKTPSSSCWWQLVYLSAQFYLSWKSFFYHLSKYLCKCFSGLLDKRRPAASARPSVPLADQRHADISGTNADTLSLVRRSTGRDLPAAHRHVTRGSWMCFHIPHKRLPGYFKEVPRNSQAVDCGKIKIKTARL